MREKPESSEWYYFKAGSNADMKAGPLSFERLCSQARGGVLEPDDVVWDPGFGWRIATQVPGLFPEVHTAKVVTLHPETQPEKLPLVPAPKSRRRYWRVWLAAGIALLIAAVALGVYFGLFYDRDGSAGDDGQTATTSAATATTLPAPVTTIAPTPTTTAPPPTTVAAPPVRTLGASDNGHEIRLHVGDRVRIELEPKVTTRVRAVDWVFLPVVVREVDSGTEKADDRIVRCWLELEAVTTGPVTVRARYSYEKASGTPWVCYFTVKD